MRKIYDYFGENPLVLLFCIGFGWWLFFGPELPPAGYVGRQGNHDIYCHWETTGIGFNSDSDYVCEKEPAKYYRGGK